MLGKLFHDCSTRLLGPHTGTCARAGTTHPLCACRLWGQLSLLSASEPKLMGKTNDQKEEAKPRARARARTQPLLLGWKYWKPSLGHLEMLIRLANSHCPWVASVELSV